MPEVAPVRRASCFRLAYRFFERRISAKREQAVCGCDLRSRSLLADRSESRRPEMYMRIAREAYRLLRHAYQIGFEMCVTVYVLIVAAMP
jgi:hypothetical protein